MSSSISFQKRSFIILSFLLFWAFLAVCHIFYYSILQREKYLAESRKIGWKEYCIPPLRGAVRDKNHVVILKTLVRYDLVVTRVHSSLEARKKRREKLKKRYPAFIFEMPPQKNRVKINPEGLYCGMILKKDLSPEEVIFYTEEERLNRDFTVKAVLLRECAIKDMPEDVMKKLGIVLPDEDGILRGVCGLEKEYDFLLSGSPGKVKVMLDKYGFWVTETISGSAPVNGKDLILSVSTEELLKGKDAECCKKRKNKMRKTEEKLCRN